MPDKLISVRWTDQSWRFAATLLTPLRLRTQAGTWRLFAGGNGNPLRLRLPNDTWQVIAREGVGGLYTHHYTTDGIQFVTSRFFDYPTGWSSYSRTGDSEATGVADPVNTGITANSPTQSFSLSTTGWDGSEFDRYYRYREQQVSWYVFPIPALRDHATTIAQGLYPTARLIKITPIFRLRGWSMLKNQMPWMNSYYDASTNQAFADGWGFLFFLQAATQTEGPYTWQPDWWSSQTYNLTTVPVVRNKPTVRETGNIVWTGPLNFLGVLGQQHGQSRPEFVVKHDLPVNFGWGAIYHHWVTEVGDVPPPSAHIYPGFTRTNMMEVWYDIDFVFAVN